MTTNRLLISVVGPTGSGKSALAVAIGERIGGEIVNCDSLQLYRQLNLGTGKPTEEERARVEHHLLDILELKQVYSAGEMQRQGRAAIEGITAAGKPAILTGGTGFYYRAVLYGLSAAPPRVPELRERLRAILARRGEHFLVRMLQRVDCASAGRIQPRDHVRLLRALEVYFASGTPFSEFRTVADPWLRRFGWIGLGLSPERRILYDRIDHRVGEMLGRGWVEEVRQLLEAGADSNWKAFEAIGYREVVAHLQGKLPFEDLLQQVRRRTRQYAKRQLTWFRREQGIFWLPGLGDESPILEQALARIGAVVGSR